MISNLTSYIQDIEVDVEARSLLEVDIGLFRVPEQVCQRSTIALDLDLLIVLGLINEHDLELYLRILGHLGSDEFCYHPGQCWFDPYLSSHHHADNDALISLDIGEKYRHNHGLAEADILGRENLIQLNVLSKHGLLDLYLGHDDILHIGRAIEADVAAYVDVDVDALMDVDIKKRTTCAKPLLSHFQPVCGKTIKKEQKDKMKHRKAVDVNHCLAYCHADAALLTVNANVQVGDLAHIHVCAAILFNESDADNCHYWAGREDQPFGDDLLEDGEGCTTFLRN